MKAKASKQIEASQFKNTDGNKRKDEQKTPKQKNGNSSRSKDQRVPSPRWLAYEF